MDKRAICPNKGAFVMYKKCKVVDSRGVEVSADDYGRYRVIVKLYVPSKARRVQPGYYAYVRDGYERWTRFTKIRVSHARVVSITTLDGRPVKLKRSWRVVSAYNPYGGPIVYRKGATVTPDVFDDDRYSECVCGIHGFMCRGSAVRF